MAYASVTETRGFPYTYRRASLLTEIFEDNMKLSQAIDPFMYVHDLYDIFLSEQYDLYDGGERGIKVATDAIKGLKETREEYSDDDEIYELANMLIDEYTEYIDCFVMKGGNDNA